MGKQVDKNDFWFIENNPITKVGVYPYLGKQISQDCEPDKIYYVLRPKEELFRKETLDSLRLIPLIDGHTMIGKDFTAPEDKGLDGTLGDNVSHDTDTIYNDLKIISNKMKEEIKNGKKELSLGYFCRYDKQPGTYKGQRYDYVQRDIIANHLALVDKGRMGADVRVYDSQNIPEGETFAMDSIDIAIDKDEDIEWITVRGTHVPIKKGESKEQAVKNFLAGKKQSSGSKAEPEKNLTEEQKAMELYGFEKTKDNTYQKEYANGQKIILHKLNDKNEGVYHEAEIIDKNGNKTTKLLPTDRTELVFKYLDNEEYKGEKGKIAESRTIKEKSEPERKERKEQNPFEKTLSKSGFKKDDNNYSYTKEYADGTTISVHSEKNDDSGKFYIADIVDKNGNMSQKEYHYQGIEDVFNKLNKEYEKSEPEKAGKISQKEKRMFKNGNYYDGSPEQKELIEEDIKHDKYRLDLESNTHLKKIANLQKEIKRVEQEKYPDPDEIDSLQRQITETNKKYKRRIANYKERIAELEKAHKEWYGQDSMEYKTIQGEGKMADKKGKVAIDEDKRKIIDEIGGILKDAGLDDELIRTVIGKAEKIAYNKSEAGDDGEEVEEEEFIDEEEENVNKKPAKDKCGKDEEEDDEDKEEEEKKKVVKAFAQKEKLGKEVEDALGTFDHSEMTELEIAKYACDKLDLQVEKGQEISAVKGYLKGLAKAPKATFGYKTVAADSGIQTTDAEFEKFINKGE